MLQSLSSTEALEESLSALAEALIGKVDGALAAALRPLEERARTLEDRSKSVGGGRAIQRALDLGEPKTTPQPKTQDILPHLPAKLTVKSLVRVLEEHQFVVQNNRDKEGSLWIRDSPRFKPFAEALAARGIELRLKTDRRQYPGRWYLIDEHGVLE